MSTPIPESAIGRFQSKIRVTPGCWIWTASKRRGYGAFQVNRTTKRAAHRIAYQLYVGPIAEGLLVCHKCDNPACVNPDHLFLGTDMDNQHDMIRKGRQVIPEGIKGEANFHAKLTEVQVRAIFNDCRASRKIASEYGIGKTIVNNIKAKKKWGHLWN